jgi:hypothetical protein
MLADGRLYKFSQRVLPTQNNPTMMKSFRDNQDWTTLLFILKTQRFKTGYENNKSKS